MGYLVHYGIKGQKWGVRRYQNEDGSLTWEGRKRYFGDHDVVDNKTGKTLYRARFTKPNALGRLALYNGITKKSKAYLKNQRDIEQKRKAEEEEEERQSKKRIEELSRSDPMAKKSIAECRKIKDLNKRAFALDEEFERFGDGERIADFVEWRRMSSSKNNGLTNETRQLLREWDRTVGKALDNGTCEYPDYAREARELFRKYGDLD